MVLLVIITGVFTYNLLIPVYAPVKDFDISGFEQDVARFILIQDSLDSLKSVKFQKKRVYPEKQGNKIYEKICMEINAADSAELTKIRGIGGVFAKRIIRYREMLGGFYEKRQLMEVYGIDSTNFPGIAEQIILDTSLIKKTNINTVTFKELLKHPYLEYEDVKSLFRLKDKLGGHISREDLLNASKPDKDIINKILPYLNFETK